MLPTATMLITSDILQKYPLYFRHTSASSKCSFISALFAKLIPVTHPRLPFYTNLISAYCSALSLHFIFITAYNNEVICKIRFLLRLNIERNLTPLPRLE